MGVFFDGQVLDIAVYTVFIRKCQKIKFKKLFFLNESLSVFDLRLQLFANSLSKTILNGFEEKQCYLSSFLIY